MIFDLPDEKIDMLFTALHCAAALSRKYGHNAQADQFLDIQDEIRRQQRIFEAKENRNRDQDSMWRE